MGLEEYLVLEKKLSEFFKAIKYCGNKCIGDNLSPVFCCKENDFYFEDIGVDEYIDLYIEREKIYGFPQLKENDECRYHTNTGCVLKTHKSPVCIAWLCGEYRLRVDYYINYNRTKMRKSLQKVLLDELNPKQLKRLHVKIDGYIAKVKLVNHLKKTGEFVPRVLKEKSHRGDVIKSINEGLKKRGIQVRTSFDKTTNEWVHLQLETGIELRVNEATNVQRYINTREQESSSSV